MNYNNIIKNFIPINLKEMRKEGFLEKHNQNIKKHYLKIDSKNGWKEIINCPLCKSEKRIIEFGKFGIDIYCCENCTLRYAGKIPNKIQDIYDDESYLPDSIENYIKNVKYRKERFGTERINLIKSFVKKDKIKLLDIGCGTGWFLELAKEKGFEVYGQEIGKELSEFTSKRIGTKIWNESVEEINTSIKFDVITLFDVIEHIENPFKFLISCEKLLEKEGIIIIFTPNFNSLAIHITKENSNLIAPSEHLVYFTRKATEYLKNKLNMKFLYYKTCGIDFGDLKSYYEMIGEKDLSKACIKLYNKIQPLIDYSGAGNHMRFILKKIK